MLALAVALHLADAQGMAREDLVALVSDLGRAIERETTARAVVDEPYASECTGPNRCAAEILSRAGAERVVYLSVIGAATRVRLLAERADAEGVVSATVQADLPKERARWGSGLEGVARILFADALAPRAAAVTAESPPPEKAGPGRALAWTAAGSGVAALAAAIAFRAASDAARETIATEPLGPEALDAERSRSRAFGLASNLLFAFAAAAISGGATYLLFAQ